MNDRPPMAFGYCRVSPRPEEGMSLPAQRQQIEAYYGGFLKAKGVEWCRHYEDPSVSGKVSMDQREGGCKLLYAVQSGDHIIMTKLDRGFRRAGDAAITMDRWGQGGIVFHILDLRLDSSTPTGRLVLGIMAYFAEFERSQISERTKAVMRHRKLAGMPVGRPPYGFRCVGPKGKRTLTEDKKARDMGKLIVKWKMSGFSWEEIYFHLLKHCALNPRAKSGSREWSIGAIRRAFAGECRLLAREETDNLSKRNP